MHRVMPPDRTEQYLRNKIGLLNVFVIVYFVLVTQLIVVVFFFITNITRFMEDYFWVNGLWMVLTAIVFCTTFVVLFFYSYLYSFFCCSQLGRKGKLHTGMSQLISFIMFVHFACSFFYVITDFVLFAYRDPHSKFIDVFGDYVYGVLTLIGLIAYNFVHREIFLRQIKEFGKKENVIFEEL